MIDVDVTALIKSESNTGQYDSRVDCRQHTAKLPAEW